MQFSITNNTAFKIAALVGGIALALSLVGVFAPAADAAVCPHTFSVNLKQGATGAEVLALQQFLNMDPATQVSASGAGSPGNETTYFGGLTRAAVNKFQVKYTAEILTPNGLTAPTGNFYTSSRAKANMLCTGSTTTTPPPPSAGTGVSVAAAIQPSNSLAPASAARIPFTKFTLTAGLDGDVTVNSVTVERTGLAADANFNGVILIDENGNQVGLTKTLNSNHQASIGDNFVIPRGTSKTFTVAANRASTGNPGEVATFSVVAINTSAAVSGTLPITGAAHTINSTLALGSVTMSRGALDPGSNQTKEVGTTGYNFASIKISAGSVEDIYLRSIRWNQTGSAGASDLTNIKTVVDGTSYPTTVSSDGKYYTTVFPGQGILIQKGFNKDVTITGDVAGGSNRTVNFDIAKRTDVYLVGSLYGFGITPPLASTAAAANGSAFNSSDDPYYDGAQVTVSTGTMTVSVDTSVAAQNVAINQNNQPLGAFTVEVRGEAISVANMKFNLSTTTGLVKSVTLVDQNGAVVAGPVDSASSGTTALTFTDTVTFPIGITRLTLKGKLDSTWPNNGTIQASTTPSTQWTTVTGQVTGTTITPAPASALTSSQMTGKSGALTVSVSSVPIAQTIIAGAQAFEFARYIFDATGSGEDLRITSIPLYFDTTGTRTDLTNCQLFDGATALNTGSNIKNPSTGDTASSTNLTFDGTGLILAKGTTKTASLKCNLRSGATGLYWWGIDAGQNSSFTGASGVTSGATVAESFTDANGQVMTAAAGGSLTSTLDTNSPGYAIVSAGKTNVELARIKFSATNEDLNLRQVALKLSGIASNTPDDLQNREVTLWDADTNTQVGSAVFASSDFATSSAIAAGAFKITKDGSKVMIVRGNINTISNSGPLTASGDLLVVDYDGNNNGINGNYAVGASSGSNVTPSSASTASNGVRIMRGYPVVAINGSPLSGQLQNGTNRKLFRFSVTAVDHEVAIYKFPLNVSSSTVSATTSAYGLYAYTDSGYSSADTTFSSTGLVNVGNSNNGLGNTTGASTQVSNVNIFPMRTAYATTTYIIPAGVTRYFELQATVSGARTTTGSESITVKLNGDSAYPSGISGATTNMFAASDIAALGATINNFIWSPVSTTTSNTVNDLDYTNGYQVQGLPSTGSAGWTHTLTI